MSAADSNRVMIVLSIIERRKSKRFIEAMKARGLGVHFQSVGQGTATSEMMDILGLGSNDKGILLSFASGGTIGSLVDGFVKNLEHSAGYGGLMMVINVLAINRLAAELMTRYKADGVEKEDDGIVSGESKHNLIVIAVNQGYADDVMKTAKRAGATGGTIIRARLAGTEVLGQLDEADEREEKEIIAILAPATTGGQIMDEVNREFGMRTNAKGIVCAVPVERALKI